MVKLYLENGSRRSGLEDKINDWFRCDKYVGAWESGASRQFSEETRGAAFPQRACVTDVDVTDLDADYILGMDASNVRNIYAFVDGKSGATVARLVRSGRSKQEDIADPWYTGETWRDVPWCDIGMQCALEQLKKEL